MMIHLVDAALTHAAVMHTFNFNYSAFLALLDSRINVFGVLCLNSNLYFACLHILPLLTICCVLELILAAEVLPLNKAWIRWWACQPMRPKRHHYQKCDKTHFPKAFPAVPGIFSVFHKEPAKYIWI